MDDTNIKPDLYQFGHKLGMNPNTMNCQHWDNLKRNCLITHLV